MMMKVAVPVRDDSLQLFGNTGHAPYFAVYTIKGSGMFRAFEFEALRPNPRTDLDHDHPEEEEHHHCSHDENDEAHVREHFKMGEVLEDCDFIVVGTRTCKNTAAAMAEYGVHLKKYNGESAKADEVLRSVSAQLA
jgi:predicted Fe-Mo cluster-binding NifX family protein